MTTALIVALILYFMISIGAMLLHLVGGVTKPQLFFGLGVLACVPFIFAVGFRS